MTIGIIGLGSIGKRHAKVLHQLGVEHIVALRTRKGAISITPPELDFVTEVFSEAEFYQHNLTGVLVCTPTALHVCGMLPALQKGIPVMVEKPVAATVAEADTLLEFADKVRVAYCLRFLPLISEIRNLLANGKIGRVVKVSFERGFYLPFWHPYADYRTEYVALKELGGGVLRTFSHEIDLMQFLFGPAISVSGAVDKVSELELNTEDVAHFSCKVFGGARVNFDLDLLNPENKSACTILGTKGKLEYSFSGKVLRYSNYQNQTEELASETDFDSDKMYENQMRDFLGFIQTGRSGNCTLQEGIQVLKVIEAVEKCASVPV